MSLSHPARPGSESESAASVRERLLCMGDAQYRVFLAKLIPNVDPDRILGVRAPLLRSLARALRRTGAAEAFLNDLPHFYQEENLLHAYLLADEKDCDRCLALAEAFLPCVDNWAVCDGMSLPCFKKHRPALLSRIPEWLGSAHPYTVRFGLKMLMDHFLDEDFTPASMELAAGGRSGEYYGNMMCAWYFATALAKQWEQALPFLTRRRLTPWVHNKTIQKAIESFRVPEDRKVLLRELRWK